MNRPALAQLVQAEAGRLIARAEQAHVNRRWYESVNPDEAQARVYHEQERVLRECARMLHVCLWEAGDDQ